MAWPTVAVDTTNSDAGTDSPASARADILDLMQKVNLMISAYAAANGVASLGSLGKIPPSQIKMQLITFTSVSLTQDTAVSNSIAHSLGTDNVFVITAGAGASNDNYEAAWSRLDGYVGRADGANLASIGTNKPSAPATGNIRVRAINRSPTTQVIVIKCLVIAAD